MSSYSNPTYLLIKHLKLSYFYQTSNLSLLTLKEHIQNLIKNPHPPKLLQGVIILPSGGFLTASMKHDGFFFIWTEAYCHHCFRYKLFGGRSGSRYRLFGRSRSRSRRIQGSKFWPIYFFEVWKSVHWFKSYKPLKMGTFCQNFFFGGFHLQR